MPHALMGIAKSREDPAAMAGPPKPPWGVRVSATRQGVTGTKWVAGEITGGAAALTVNSIGIAMGLLVAPGAVIVMTPAYPPGARPIGFTVTMRVVAVSERTIQGTLAEADHENVPVPELVMSMVCAAGKA